MTLTKILRAGISANAKDMVSVLDYIPLAQHAAIRAGTSTVDVKQYIQAAITAEKTIFFPAGKYYCTSGLSLDVGTKLIGEATEKSESGVNKGTGSIIQFHSNSTSNSDLYNGIVATQKNKIEFYNIVIKTTEDFTGEYAVKFVSTYSCRFHNVVIVNNGTNSNATGLFMNADDGDNSTKDYAWSNFFDNCLFGAPRSNKNIKNSDGDITGIATGYPRTAGHTFEFYGSDSWFNNIYSSGGKGIKTTPGGNNWSNIHCEHSHSAHSADGFQSYTSGPTYTGTSAGFTVCQDNYDETLPTNKKNEGLINVSNLYCDLNDIAVRWESNGVGAYNSYFNFSNVLCRSNRRADFQFKNTGNSATGASGGSIVNYQTMGTARLNDNSSNDIRPIETIGTITQPSIQADGSNITNKKIGIDTDTPQVLLDAGGSVSGGITGLEYPVLYAGCGQTSSNNYGGVVLGSGATCNNPFVAATRKSGGTSSDGLPLHFITNATQRLTIAADGKVGIDSNSPNVLLDTGGSSTGGLAGLNSPVLYAGFKQQNSNNYGGIVLGTGATGNAPYVAAAKQFDGTSALSLSFYTNATRRLKIHETSGNINIEDGDLKFASGHGIDFSAVSDASRSVGSNIFKDYEEGTWTPTFNFGSATGSFGYNAQIGRYTRIGNRVFYTCIIRSNSHSGTTNGNIRIAGLPYAVKDDYPSGGTVFLLVGGNFDTNYGLAPQLNGSEQIEFYKQVQSTGNNFSALDSSELNLSIMFFKVEGHYYTEG